MANSDFDLTFSNIEGWKREIEKTKKETGKKIKEAELKAEQKRAIEIAKKLLKDKVSVSGIVKYTRLTKKQVEHLKQKM